MTRILKALIPILLAVASLGGVAQAQTVIVPDCFVTGRFTATARQGGPPATPTTGLDNRLRGCTNWVLTLSSTGFSATSIALQSAEDSSGSAGSWANWEGTVVSGTNPSTTTTSTSIQASGYYPWISVNATTLTGSGTVVWTLAGWKEPMFTAPVTISGTVNVDPVANTIGLATETTLDRVADAVEDTAPVSVLPWTGTIVKGAVTTAMTGTTSTEVIAAVASNYHYITWCVVSNASTTVSTDILLQVGSGGSTLAVLPAPAAAVATTGGGGSMITFPTPLPVTTVNTGLFAANVTTGSSTKISCGGFRSTVAYF